MRCVIFLLTFSSEVEREKKRVVLNCEREIKSNKWLAEGNAFGEVGSMHTNRCDRTCHSSRSVALPSDTSYWCETSPSVGRHWTFRKRTNGRFFSLSCWGSKWPVRGKRCVLVRRRVGVCAFSQSDLRKGGVSIPPTKDIRWVEAARKSSKQLWWPSFLMPRVV